MIPPIDHGVGAAGAVPTRNPFPTNAALNNFIDDQVAEMSRAVKIAGDATPILYPLAGQSANGPYQIRLQSIAPTGSVNDVRRVTWLPDGINEVPLLRWNREELDRDRTGFMTQPPGAPEGYWEEFGVLSVWPSPASGGTLSIMFGKALWSQAQDVDGEVPEIIPSDFWPMIDYGAALLVCASQPANNVFASQANIIQARYNRIYPQFQSWAQRMNRMQEASMVPDTGRAGFFGGRR